MTFGYERRSHRNEPLAVQVGLSQRRKESQATLTPFAGEHLKLCGGADFVRRVVVLDDEYLRASQMRSVPQFGFGFCSPSRERHVIEEFLGVFSGGYRASIFSAFRVSGVIVPVTFSP